MQSLTHRYPEYDQTLHYMNGLRVNCGKNRVVTFSSHVMISWLPECHGDDSTRSMHDLHVCRGGRKFHVKCGQFSQDIHPQSRAMPSSSLKSSHGKTPFTFPRMSQLSCSNRDWETKKERMIKFRDVILDAKLSDSAFMK